MWSLLSRWPFALNDDDKENIQLLREDAVKAASPKPEEEDNCRASIDAAIFGCASVASTLRRHPKKDDTSEKFEAMDETLTTVIEAADELDKLYVDSLARAALGGIRSDFRPQKSDLIKSLEAMRDNAREMASKTKPSNPAHTSYAEPSSAFAADRAYDILNKYAPDRPPTPTPGGAFVTLAEAISYIGNKLVEKAEQPMEHVCREVLKKRNKGEDVTDLIRPRRAK